MPGIDASVTPDMWASDIFVPITTLICEVVAPDSASNVIFYNDKGNDKEYGSNTNAHDDLEKLRELVKDIDFCMLTTVDEQGEMHSRPMSANGDIDPNGSILSPGRTFYRVGARCL